MDIELLKSRFHLFFLKISEWASSPQFYAQCGMLALAIFVAFVLASLLKKYSPVLRDTPRPGAFRILRNGIYQASTLLFPLFTVLSLGIAADLTDKLVQQSGLVRIAQSLAMIFLLYSIITRFIRKPLTRILFTWISIPIALLYVFGWLSSVTAYLDTIDMEVGNIRISAYAVIRVLIFGSILFWLGRISNTTGQQIIRRYEGIEAGTREVVAKLFEVALFVTIFILLLQVMGINLTTLAVFGGALGVGLGFGLQAIASNFISGIIILLDRSLTVGDYIQLEDGRNGTIISLNMRSTVLETYDGKCIMVPNEKFITTSFVNWTHNNTKQRYEIKFQVAYKTDIRSMLALVKAVVETHPQVIGGPGALPEELPDAEIAGFGDSGVNILVEFWMEGIDDGKNRVGGDLWLMIWDILKENQIEIPFPQREVRILDS